MAKNKKGFVLYADQHELFNQLSDEQAGKLIKHVFAYVNDENPITSDVIINLAFTPIRQQLKRDLKKYEDRAVRSRENGKSGGRPKPKEPTGFSRLQKEPKEPDTVTVTVKDTVTDMYREFTHLSLSIEDYDKLRLDFEGFEIDTVLDSIENFKGNTKYKSLYLTALNWLKRDYPKKKKSTLVEHMENQIKNNK